MERLYPISEVVSSYCLQNFNDSRKYYANYLEHARWIWKEIFADTEWSVVRKKVRVDKTVHPYRIAKPKDMAVFVNVSVPDQSCRMRALWVDDNMDVTPSAAPDSACKKCGEVDELSACLGRYSLKLSQVEIAGQSYTEKRWVENDSSCLYEVLQTPVQDFNKDGSSSVKTITRRVKIADVETKEGCGCIKRTEANVEAVSGCCYIPKCDVLQVTGRPYDYYGLVKVTSGGIFLKGDIPDEVLLVYQASGEVMGEEIMIPEIAVSVVQFGISWRAGAMAMNVGPQQERNRRRNYTYLRNELLYQLNPIRVEEFVNSQMRLPKWGEAGGHVEGKCPSFQYRQSLPVTAAATVVRVEGSAPLPTPTPTPVPVQGGVRRTILKASGGETSLMHPDLIAVEVLSVTRQEFALIPKEHQGANDISMTYEFIGNEGKVNFGNELEKFEVIQILWQ